MSSYQIKAVLLGDSSVGKSSLIHHYCSNGLPMDTNNSPTVGIDFKIKKIESNNPLLQELHNNHNNNQNNNQNIKELKAYFWDTAGQERFKAIIRSYYKGINILILVYDVSNMNTFSSIPSWYDEFLQNCGTIDTHLVKVLIANKSDLRREVPREYGEKYATENDMLFYELSVVRDISGNINRSFDNIIIKRGSNTHGLIEYFDKESGRNLFGAGSFVGSIGSIGNAIVHINGSAVKSGKKTCCY